MRKIWAMFAMAMVVAGCQCPCKAENVAPEKFTALFDGKDLTNWRGRKADLNPDDEAKLSKQEHAAAQDKWNADRDKHWTVDAKTGEISNDGNKEIYLSTEKEYGDFELLIDWKFANPHADSGIYLRGYPQVQIWDPEYDVEIPKGSQKGSGGLYNNTVGTAGQLPANRGDHAVGEWNTFRIKMIGGKVWVWLNDKVAVDGATLENTFDKTKAVNSRGPIVLQGHAGVVKFRNIYIREIGADEAKAAAK